MSRDNVLQFIKDVGKNEVIQGQLNNLGEEGIEGVIRDNGYDFSVNELQEVVAEVGEAQDGEGELPDELLDMVSGGGDIKILLGRIMLALGGGGSKDEGYTDDGTCGVRG